MNTTFRVDGYSDGFWGAVQEHYTTARQAERWAKGNMKMPWRIVAIEERVVLQSEAIAA